MGHPEIARSRYTRPRSCRRRARRASRPGRYTPDVSARGRTPATCALVEVDPATGAVEILRYVVSEDCGVMINPNVVEGQIAGGVVQGIGGVLYEHFVYDEAGNPLATTFVDYLAADRDRGAEIEYAHIETPRRRTRRPQGARGGRRDRRPALPSSTRSPTRWPLGVEVRDQPLGPAEIVAMIEEAGGHRGPERAPHRIAGGNRRVRPVKVERVGPAVARMELDIVPGHLGEVRRLRTVQQLRAREVVRRPVELQAAVASCIAGAVPAAPTVRRCKGASAASAMVSTGSQMSA